MEDYKKQSNSSHGGIRWCMEQRRLFCEFLLEINEQSVYLLSYQRTIRYISIALCAIGTSLT